jgi:hypothetical protein
MHASLTSDLLHQLTQDRQQDLRASAAARRLTGVDHTARRRVARTLRRAADRLDAATTASGKVGSAVPGRG